MAARTGEPKKLRQLFDVLHLLARSAAKTLIHHDIQSAPGPPATQLATNCRVPVCRDWSCIRESLQRFRVFAG
jgi:hypothetical protein